MNDEADFGVSRQGVLDLTASLERAGADSLVNAFPAALLAPTWRALLEAGGIEAPTRVDLDRVEVNVIGPTRLELRVPVRVRDGELIKSVPVIVRRWTSDGELPNMLYEEARSLASAMELAVSQPAVELGGEGQKPKN
jgi:hypothetical protein